MIVLDSCAACEIVRRTDEGLALQALLSPQEKIVSCELIYAELGSIFRKLIVREATTKADAKIMLNAAVSLVDEFATLSELSEEAFTESVRLDHSTYDLYYLVLARRLGATLFTLDRKLIELCKANGVDCCEVLDT